jgi:hypothetical protein
MAKSSEYPGGKNPPLCMKVFVRPGSEAHRMRSTAPGQSRARADEIAAPFQPQPSKDLKFRGGKTIPHLKYLNFYVGGKASWDQSDADSIDTTLANAMSDPRLNNVMRQYFANAPITTTFLGTQFVGSKRPRLVTQTSVKNLVKALFNGGQLSGVDFPSTVLNFLLPKGTVLTDGTGPGQQHEDDDNDERGRGSRRTAKVAGAPEREQASSLAGLGGYHGSADIGQNRIYYSVGVFSQILPNGRENGIAIFTPAWKNVVATFYHELNEARTDPDVDIAIETGEVQGNIGWNSDDGEECGDFPVDEAGQIGDFTTVFQEVTVQGGGTSPVQFQYSNAVHGPEGPIALPHIAASPHEIEDHGHGSTGQPASRGRKR